MKLRLPDATAIVRPHEHVIFVVVDVPRLGEELSREHLRGENLLIASLAALGAAQLDQLVVDVRASGQEEGRARRVVVAKPELLLLSDVLVVEVDSFAV